jgi:hypothetical protein
LYALTREVVIQFEETILTADDLNSSSVSKSAIILMMFGFLWGLGLLLLLVSFSQQQIQKDKIQTFNSQKIKALSRNRTTDPTSTVDMNRVLTKYLDEVFPVVFHTESYLMRLRNELLRHHRYIQLLSSRKDAIGRRKVVTCFHLLTIQTMLMFLLGLCYELQVTLLPFIVSASLSSLFPFLVPN